MPRCLDSASRPTKEGSTWIFLVAHSAIQGDVWTHITVSYDGDTDLGRLYLDDQLVDIASGVYNPDDTGKDLYFGRLQAGHPFYGDMDDIQLFNYAIPEPGTLVLLLGALVGLVLLRARR